MSPNKRLGIDGEVRGSVRSYCSLWSFSPVFKAILSWATVRYGCSVDICQVGVLTVGHTWSTIESRHNIGFVVQVESRQHAYIPILSLLRLVFLQILTLIICVVLRVCVFSSRNFCRLTRRLESWKVCLGPPYTH